MALSETQKAQIRLYLGYPDAFRYLDTRLESMLNNLSAPAETFIGDALTKLAAIEVGIANGVDSSATAAATLGAGIKRVGEVWFFGGNETGSTTGGGFTFKNLKTAGKFYRTKISIITGVPIFSDIFGNEGYLGDSFSGLGRRNSGGGGFFGLG